MTEANTKRQTPRSLLDQLATTFPVFRRAQPLAIGIHKALQERLPDVAPGLLHAAIKLHVDSTRYLKVIADGKDRHDLDGKIAGAITPEQKALAAGRVRERAQKAVAQRKAEDERRQQEVEARERQEKLLRLAQKFNRR